MSDLQHLALTPDEIRRKQWIWRTGVAAVVAAGVWHAMGFRWGPIIASWPFILKGLWTSIWLAAVSLAIGFVLATVLATLRAYGPRGVRHVTVAFIDVIRALPELMVIFWVFFSIPRLTGQPLGGTSAAILALSAIAAAYLSEVIRAGLNSVPKGQWEAGFSSGLSGFQILTRIVMPQAMRNMIPALIGQSVMLFKTTSLVYIVGVVEFFRAMQIINTSAFSPQATYTLLAVGYYLCCSVLSYLVHRFDRGYSVVDQ